jgi:hypothetical protein
MSRIEEGLIQEYAQAAAATVVEKTIAGLSKCTETLSGDDSGLRNAWEEICVQVQTLSDEQANKKPGFTRASGCYWTLLDVELVPLVGFELTTYRLQGGCSTPELKRQRATL